MTSPTSETPQASPNLSAVLEAQSRLDGLLLECLALQAPRPSPELDAMVAERLAVPAGLPADRPYASDEAAARSLLRPHEDVLVVPDAGRFWALVSVPRLGRRDGAPRDVWRLIDGRPARAWGDTPATAICGAILVARVVEAAGLCAFAGASPALARALDYAGACLRFGEG
jgi:hypothetical protein